MSCSPFTRWGGALYHCNTPSSRLFGTQYTEFRTSTQTLRFISYTWWVNCDLISCFKSKTRKQQICQSLSCNTQWDSEWFVCLVSSQLQKSNIELKSCSEATADQTRSKRSWISFSFHSFTVGLKLNWHLSQPFILLHKTTETHTHTHTHTHRKAACFLYKRHQIRAGLPRAARRWRRWAARLRITQQNPGQVLSSCCCRGDGHVSEHLDSFHTETEWWDERRSATSDHVWPGISALCFSGESWFIK